jgi:hypothetical protein
MQKLPNAKDLFGPIAVWEHLWMNSEDDPEARIRELEEPLADTARASEAAESQSPSKWAAPSAPPHQPPPLPYSGSQPPPLPYSGPQPPPLPYSGPQPPPLPYSGSLFGQSLQTSSRSRTWWIVAAVFVIGMIALPAGILLFTAHQVSHSGMPTFAPIPSMSLDSPAPSGGLTQTPAAGPLMPPAGVPTAPTGENLVVSGINENRTVVCNQNTVSISGVSNTVVITGHCTRLSVSGVQNKVTVEGVDSIEESGFNNEVTYHKGFPQIDQSGQGNVAHRG